MASALESDWTASASLWVDREYVMCLRSISEEARKEDETDRQRWKAAKMEMAKAAMRMQEVAEMAKRVENDANGERDPQYKKPSGLEGKHTFAEKELTILVERPPAPGQDDGDWIKEKRLELEDWSKRNLREYKVKKRSAKPRASQAQLANALDRIVKGVCQ